MAIMGRRAKFLAAALVAWSAQAAAQAPTPSASNANPVASVAAETTNQTPAADGICRALEQAAGENRLPVAFFARLIWQESRFNTRAVSRKGAEGIAQFMPATASFRGLADPFDPIPALQQAASYLADLRKRFGSLGLAAAGYNAGPGRVAAWLARRSVLPRETRNYVAITTGRPADQWRSARQSKDAEMTIPRGLPCTTLVNLNAPKPQEAEAEPRPQMVSAGLVVGGAPDAAPTPMPSLGDDNNAAAEAIAKTSTADDMCCAADQAAPALPPPSLPRWGMQLAANWSKELAWASYRRIEKQYASVLAGRPAVMVETRAYGPGSAIRYTIRIGDDDWPALQKLCNALIMAGGACVVLPNAL
jgi:hypothetical protein